MQKVINYSGLYGEQMEGFSDDFIHCEPIRKRSALYDFEITEHLHTDLVQLFVIYSGGGLLLSNERKIALSPPCAVLIPNNVLHGFVYPSDVSGRVITLSRSLYDRSVEGDSRHFLSVDDLHHVSLDGGGAIFGEVVGMIPLIEREVASDKPHRATVLRLRLQLLLLTILRESADRPRQTISSDNRTLLYYDSFRKLIKEHLHDSLSVQDYARMMGISSVHLNRVCQALVQKSALQVVHGQILQEAIRYLRGTDKSIREVAYFLDFTDGSHFSKFFKKMTGFTPSAYRKKNP